jgi:predicted aspartyl protease
MQIQIEIPAQLAAQLQKANQPIPKPVLGMALIDTGATCSGIDQTVVQQLGLQPVGVQKVGTAGGMHDQSLYPARLSFPGTGFSAAESKQLLGVDLAGQVLAHLNAPMIALIGRDILARFILIYNGPAGQFTPAF